MAIVLHALYTGSREGVRISTFQGKGLDKLENIPGVPPAGIAESPLLDTVGKGFVQVTLNLFQQLGVAIPSEQLVGPAGWLG